MTAGITIRMEARGDALLRLSLIAAGIRDRPRFHAAASELMLDQTQDRFRGQHDPDGVPWAALRPATVAARGSSRPILEASGSLRGGLHASADASAARVSTAPLVYAAIHQTGGLAGSGRQVKIPARPYLGFHDDDVREIAELAEEMLGLR